MSRLRTILFGIIFGILAFFAYRFLFHDNSVKTLKVQKNPKVLDVQRVGINLGKWTPWGAAQYSSNVLFNPGFEAGISRAIVVVDQFNNNQVHQIDSPNFYLDHFWDGAQFEVLTGDLMGSFGRIKESRKTGAETIYTLDVPFALKKGDALVLTKFDSGTTPNNWWVSNKDRHLVGVDVSQKRPNSPGSQSVIYTLNQHENPAISSYLDTLEKAGKMLPLDGHWSFSIWAKASNLDIQLFVELNRQDIKFIDQVIPLTNEWKEIHIEFEGVDQGPFAPIQLKLTGLGQSGSIWLDDVSLSKTSKFETHGFRQELVDALKKLRPGVIRNWQGQLGDTFRNSVATEFGRKPSRYKMAYGDLEYDFFYSLTDFLTLCEEVEALPWIIYPPGFTKDEMVSFANFLKTHASKERFSKVFVEYGHEIWNFLYESGQPILSYDKAELVFKKLQELVGNHVVLQSIVSDMIEEPRFAENRAISPFILKKLETGVDDQAILRELFEPLEIKHKNPFISEINLHTLGGSAKIQERNRVVASQAAGLALANHLLHAIDEGVQAISVFKLAGFDFVNTQRMKGFYDSEVRLFGVVRDLGSTCAFRPQGLALQALNQVIAGNFHPFEEGYNIKGGAFINQGQCNFALSSSSPDVQEFRIKLPPNLKPPTLMTRLHASSLFDSNEDKKLVKLKEEKVKLKGNDLFVTVPPYGLIVLY